MIVSHDRAFLDDTVDDIILLADKRLSYHAGNYTAFVEEIAEQCAKRAQQRDALARKADRIQASITKERASATKSGDCKKQVWCSLSLRCGYGGARDGPPLIMPPVNTVPKPFWEHAIRLMESISRAVFCMRNSVLSWLKNCFSDILGNPCQGPCMLVW